jgi:aryl carrier-like protein
LLFEWTIMSEFLKRLEQLSPEKQELMKLFLHEEGLQAPRENHVAPRTHVEETLAGIWSEVLGVNEVGIHDNFFALGGDSIHSIQVIARANRAGLGVSSTLLFQHPTIAELAAATKEAGQNPVATAAKHRLSPPPNASSSAITPHEFPEADLSPDDLARIIRKLA